MNEVMSWAEEQVKGLIQDNAWRGTWDEAMLVAEEQLREFDLHRPEQAEQLSDEQWEDWQQAIAHKLVAL